MNYWRTLGVEPGADQKTIKLAYSKLLKSTRPDDDPEGFARLHSAYKAALLATQRTGKTSPAGVHAPPQTSVNTTDTGTRLAVESLQEAGSTVAGAPQPALVDPPDITLTVETVKAPQDAGGQPEVESIVSPAADSSNDIFQQAEYEQELQKDASLIETRLQELLASRRTVNKVERWQFIESVDSMVDLDFSAQVSDRVFGAVSAANTESLKTGGLKVNQPVLRYLNDYFQWDKNWQHFEDTYGHEQAQSVFRFVSDVQANSKSRALPYFARILAFFVDMILGGICWYIALEQPAASWFSSIGVLYFLLVIPVMEASPWQASVGKRMFSLVVIDKNGLRLPWYHSFIRSYVSYFCLAGIKVVVWINMFTSYKYNALLQDIISRSYVVERE